MIEIGASIAQFKKIMIDQCDDSRFSYREWFVQDHLQIVEGIALEICDMYPQADRDIVHTLVWFHDFGKPLDEKNESHMTETKGVEALRSCGFEPAFIEKVLAYWHRMEMKNTIDIAEEPIEVQIVSSADGASHFVGKFHASYFRDDPHEPLAHIEDRLRAKIRQDWERKITIPEVKRSFAERYTRALEITGEYPERFIV